MRDARAVVALVARAGADPEAERDRAHARHLLRDHALARVELREDVLLHEAIVPAVAAARGGVRRRTRRRRRCASPRRAPRRRAGRAPARRARPPGTRRSRSSRATPASRASSTPASRRVRCGSTTSRASSPTPRRAAARTRRPPIRKASSDAAERPREHEPTKPCSASSPAGCPCRSFSDLKPSRSATTSAERAAVARGPRHLPVEPLDERAPVQQPRERVVVGEEAQLVEVAAGDDRSRGLVREDPQRLEPVGGGQQPVLGVVRPRSPRAAAHPRRHGAGRAASAGSTPSGRARSAATHRRSSPSRSAGAPRRPGAGSSPRPRTPGRRAAPRSARSSRPASAGSSRPQPTAACGTSHPLPGSTSAAHTLRKPSASRMPAADAAQDLVGGHLAGEPRGDGEQLLEGALVPGRVGRLPCGLHGERRVVGERDEHVQLVVGGAHAVDGLVHGEDSEHGPVGAAHRHEQRVLGSPRVRAGRPWLDGGYVREADRVPVHRSCGHDERAAAEKALVEERRPSPRPARMRPSSVVRAASPPWTVLTQKSSHSGR